MSEAVDSLKGDSTDPYLGVVKTVLIRYQDQTIVSSDEVLWL